jgi:hypothetical protein
VDLTADGRGAAREVVGRRSPDVIALIDARDLEGLERMFPL